MTKVVVAEALYRVADRCVQVTGGTGELGDTVVEQVFREIRASHICDDPTEVHKWELPRRSSRRPIGGMGMSAENIPAHLCVSDERRPLNRQRLQAWLETHIEGFIAPLTSAKFSGGQSSPTFRIAAKSSTYVLRRKPAGHMEKGARH